MEKEIKYIDLLPGEVYINRWSKTGAGFLMLVEEARVVIVFYAIIILIYLLRTILMKEVLI